MVKNYPALKSLLPDLAASLRDPEAPSLAAREILDEIMRTVVNSKPKVEKQIQALEKAGTPEATAKAKAIRAAMPTAFPTFSSNVWIEYINAKALWIRNEGEDRELLPGDKGEGADGKPDYKTPHTGGGHESARVLGDHIGVKLGDNPATVASQVSSSIMKKVEKYKPFQMRVIVDVTRAPAKQAMWETPDHGKAQIVRNLNPELTADSNFRSASIMFSDTDILEIQFTDCTPTKPPERPGPATTAAPAAPSETKEGKTEDV
jgi:hypothetical protein